MGMMTAADTLSAQAKTLPEDMAREVLDFLEFLRQKRTEQEEDQQDIKAALTVLAKEPTGPYKTLEQVMQELDDMDKAA